MFDKIQHIGYYCADLEAAIAWYNQGFGALSAGGGDVAVSVQVPGGGINAFLRFGQVEVELIQPGDTSGLPSNGLVMHHVAYVVPDIHQAIAECRARGFRFTADAPRTNQLGQQLLYFHPETTNNVLMHLTQLPAPEDCGADRRGRRRAGGEDCPRRLPGAQPGGRHRLVRGEV